MDAGLISAVLLMGMLFLLAIGMPLAFASGVLAVAVMAMKFGVGMLFSHFGMGPLNILAQRIYGVLTNYALISVPLFIFMALMLERSGIARDMYSSLNMWLSRTRGGIAIVTSIMAIVMAAMSGIIGGEVVLLGLIALPQMLRLGYNQSLAIGTICASGTLGTMIPPSIVLIMYGLVTETSIHSLFKAAFFPGFMLGGFYIVYIIIRTRLNPSLAPLPEMDEDQLAGLEKTKCFVTLLGWMLAVWGLGRLVHGAAIEIQNGFGGLRPEEYLPYSMQEHLVSLIALLIGLAGTRLAFGQTIIAETWRMSKGLVAPFIIVGVVLGSIYGGITGITEAAGMGSIIVLLIVAIRKELNFSLIKQAASQTFISTGSILSITMGATALAGAYTMAGGPTYIANLIIGADMPTYGVLLIMMVIFLFLGAFMDWVGIVLLVMPVFLPIVVELPRAELGLLGPMVDHASLVPIWFGVVFTVAMQVAFLSPPFGPAAFFLKSVAPPHITLPDIFKGFIPFIGIQVLVLLLVLFFPELTMVFL